MLISRFNFDVTQGISWNQLSPTHKKSRLIQNNSYIIYHTVICFHYQASCFVLLINFEYQRKTYICSFFAGLLLWQLLISSVLWISCPSIIDGYNPFSWSTQNRPSLVQRCLLFLARIKKPFKRLNCCEFINLIKVNQAGLYTNKAIVLL